MMNRGTQRVVVAVIEVILAVTMVLTLLAPMLN